VGADAWRAHARAPKDKARGRADLIARAASADKERKHVLPRSSTRSSYRVLYESDSDQSSSANSALISGGRAGRAWLEWRELVCVSAHMDRSLGSRGEAVGGYPQRGVGWSNSLREREFVEGDAYPPGIPDFTAAVSSALLTSNPDTRYENRIGREALATLKCQLALAKKWENPGQRGRESTPAATPRPRSYRRPSKSRHSF
jgi:hypothetical protein